MRNSAPSLIAALFGAASLLAGCWPTELPAQELGRLFLSPAERAALNGLRSFDEISATSVPVAEFEESEELSGTEEEPSKRPDEVYSIEGLLQQGNGTFLVWINGEIVASEDLPGFMEIVRLEDGFWLQVADPSSGRTYLLKPGQILNLTQGELLESYLATVVIESSPEDSEIGAVGDADEAEVTEASDNISAAEESSDPVSEAEELIDSLETVQDVIQ